jgi:hypothetical protein
MWAGRKTFSGFSPGKVFRKFNLNELLARNSMAQRIVIAIFLADPVP